MRRIRVRSSHIRSVGYNKDQSCLEIKFKNREVYQYHDVPVDVWKGLMASMSKGQYMHKNVRGKYKHKRLETPT